MNRFGFSLVELMMSSGVSIVVGLGLIATLNFAVERVSLVAEQVKAEESLAFAGYQLSKYLSQAVKLRCCRGPNCMTNGGVASPIPHPTFNQVDIGGEPVGIADGVIDCRAGSTTGYVGARQHALALFTREVGIARPDGSAYSQYRGSAIYFVPALQDAQSGYSGIGDNSGRIEFLDAAPGAAFQQTSNFDRMVWIGVNEGFPGGVPNGVADIDEAAPVFPGGPSYLRSMSFRLTARYFEAASRGAYHYRPAAPLVPHRDVSTVVTILFRNNRIGTSTLNGVTSERPLGQIYFFRTLAPTIGGRE